MGNMEETEEQITKDEALDAPQNDMQDEKRANGRFDKNVWLHIVGEIGKQKKLLIASFVASSLMGLFEVGVALVTRHVIDTFVVRGEADSFFPLIALAVLMSCLCFLFTFCYIRFAGKIELEVLHSLRVRIFEKYLRLNLSFYDATSTGHLMARITSDISKIGEVLSWGFVDFVWQVVVLVFTIIAMLILSVKLTLITCLMVPFILFFSSKINASILKKNRQVSSLNSKMVSAYTEDIHSLFLSKTLSREDVSDKEFAILSKKFKASSIAAFRVMALMLFCVFGIGTFDSVLVTILASHDVMRGVLTIGTLTAFQAMLLKLIEPLSWFADIFSFVISVQPSVERVVAILEEPIEMQDSEEARKIECDECLKEKVIRGEIVFDDVSFEYKKGEPVLKHFNLKVEPGERIALVGATGAGKTTIANLFCHFYEPTSGHISMAGIDYRNIPHKWISDNLGYVLQTPYLFTGSIMDNIRYGSQNASDDEVIRALELVGASSFIEKLDAGYHTHLGEDGAILSTGQKQLLSLARILVRNPAFFVLDEATAYIDSESEKKVQEAIELTLKGRTSFVIAHRLSTIRTASKICVIEKGVMTECGTHEQLMAKKGAYYEFYKRQAMGDELAGN